MAYRMIETESMRERGGSKKRMHKLVKGMYAMLDELCEGLEEDEMSERGGMYEREDDEAYERMSHRRGRDSMGRYM